MDLSGWHFLHVLFCEDPVNTKGKGPLCVSCAAKWITWADGVWWEISFPWVKGFWTSTFQQMEYSFSLFLPLSTTETLEIIYT